MTGRLFRLFLLVILLVLNCRLIFTGIAAYQQVVALVAESYIIREKLPGLGVAHVFDEYHAVIFQYLFLLGKSWLLKSYR